MYQIAQQFCLKGNNDFALYTDFFLLPYPYPATQQFCLKEITILPFIPIL
jgi:hypothetical protein